MPNLSVSRDLLQLMAKNEGYHYSYDKKHEIHYLAIAVVAIHPYIIERKAASHFLNQF